MWLEFFYVICEMLAATIDCLVFFGLSALRFIVAVCFFFNVSIRLFGPLSAMYPPLVLCPSSPAFED